MHSLVVTHHLLKVERILLVYRGSEGRIGFLSPFPPRALVVQVAGAALINELKLLSGFSEDSRGVTFFDFSKPSPAFR